MSHNNCPVTVPVLSSPQCQRSHIPSSTSVYVLDRPRVHLVTQLFQIRAGALSQIFFLLNQGHTLLESVIDECTVNVWN